MPITCTIDASGRRNVRGVPPYRLEACLVRQSDNTTVWCCDIPTTHKLTCNNLNPESFLSRDVYIRSEPFYTNSELLQQYLTIGKLQSYVWTIKLYGHPMLSVPWTSLNKMSKFAERRYECVMELVRSESSSMNDPCPAYILSVTIFSGLLSRILSEDSGNTYDVDKGELYAVTQLARDICERYLHFTRRHETSILEVFQSIREKNISGTRSSLARVAHTERKREHQRVSLLVARVRFHGVKYEEEGETADEQPDKHEVVIVPHLINHNVDSVFRFALPPMLAFPGRKASHALRCTAELCFVSAHASDESIVGIQRQSSTRQDQATHLQRLLAETTSSGSSYDGLLVPFSKEHTIATSEFLVVPPRSGSDDVTIVKRGFDSYDAPSRSRLLNFEPRLEVVSDPCTTARYCYLIFSPLTEIWGSHNDKRNVVTLRTELASMMLQSPIHLSSLGRIEKIPVFRIDGSLVSKLRQEIRLWDIDRKLAKLLCTSTSTSNPKTREEEADAKKKEPNDLKKNEDDDSDPASAEDALLLVLQLGVGCKCPSDIMTMKNMVPMFGAKYGHDFAKYLIVSWLANNADLTYIVHKTPLTNDDVGDEQKQQRQLFLDRIVLDRRRAATRDDQRLEMLRDLHRALLRAARYESYEMFAFLLRNLEITIAECRHKDTSSSPSCDAKEISNDAVMQHAIGNALVCACFNGNVSVVDRILLSLQESRPKTGDMSRYVHTALVSAVENLKTEVIRKLIAFVHKNRVTYGRNFRLCKATCFNTLYRLYASGTKELDDVKKLLLDV